MVTREKMVLEEGLQRGARHEEEVMTVVILVAAVGVVILYGKLRKRLHTQLLTVCRFVCT